MKLKIYWKTDFISVENNEKISYLAIQSINTKSKKYALKQLIKAINLQDGDIDFTRYIQHITYTENMNNSEIIIYDSDDKSNINDNVDHLAFNILANVGV